MSAPYSLHKRAMRFTSAGGKSNQTPGVDASDRMAVCTLALSIASMAPARVQATCDGKCGMLRFASQSSHAFWYSGA